MESEANTIVSAQAAALMNLLNHLKDHQQEQGYGGAQDVINAVEVWTNAVNCLLNSMQAY